MKLLAMIALLLSIFPLQAKEKRYIFSVKVMTQIAQDVGREIDFKENPKTFINEVHTRLYEAYPELVVPPGEGIWTFNSVGGSLAEIKVLFCSPTEYLSLWGSPLETEGFSGRYPALDVWDIMLSGEMKSYKPGDHKYDIYRNNPNQDEHQTSLLHKRVGKHFWLKEGTYMIDYGRGNLISALNAGAILGHKYVTGDKKSKKEMMGECSKMTFKNLSSKRKKAIKHYRATNPDYI